MSSTAGQSDRVQRTARQSKADERTDELPDECGQAQSTQRKLEEIVLSETVSWAEPLKRIARFYQRSQHGDCAESVHRALLLVMHLMMIKDNAAICTVCFFVPRG
eukprot:scaffold110885_cov16-Prasinocladus_malaysianus.AAC.1